MPKVKHIARFTTPVKLPTFSESTISGGTPVTKHKLPDRLIELNKQRLENKKTLLDLIELALVESNQPLTASELSHKLAQELQRDFDSNVVRVMLKELVSQGRVSTRVETSSERSTRAGGGRVRALHAMLFWAPAGEVPERTVTEAVPGVTLSDRSGRPVGAKVKKKTVEEVPASNEVIDLLIERIVAERTADLTRRLEAAEAALVKIRSIVKSSILE